jgi:Right handed beta helix region
MVPEYPDERSVLQAEAQREYRYARRRRPRPRNHRGYAGHHGLTFQDTTWLVPDSEGYIGDQASIVYTQVLPEDEVASYPGHRLPAGFHLEAADHIRLERNTFRNMGASAVNLYVATNDNVVIGNVITEVAGSGISIDLNLEGNPADPRKVSRRNTIANNYIARTGRDYYQTVGIMVGYGESTVIEHNEVVDMPFSGISVGWGWADRDNAARNNVVRYNEVSRVLQLMDDGGGIYTLSRQPGTVVAENHIHNLVRPPTPIAGSYGSGAIFLDNGSNLITVRDNVILDVGDDIELIKINDNGPSNSLINNAGSSSATIANAGLQPAYQDIRPSSP